MSLLSGNEKTSGTVSTTPATVVNEVPDQMKKLVRLVMRMFYPVEHQLVMDMLVRNSIMTEDDLCDRLLFERKQLRMVLAHLKNDKFVCTKMQLQTVSKDAAGGAATSTDTGGASTAPGGGSAGSQGTTAAAGEKSMRITYYYIDYKLFTNVLKYRLDMMRKRLETEQRDTTSRASFFCPGCGNTYTDLQISHLFDRATGSLFCTYCQSEVQEKEDQSDTHMNARARMSKFQTQVRDPIDALLKACDGIHLSSATLEPVIKPLPFSRETDISMADPRGGSTGTTGAAGASHKWSGEKSRGSSSLGADMNGTGGARGKNITVTFNSASEESQLSKNPLKEQPTWLKESVSLTRGGLEGTLGGSSSSVSVAPAVVVTGAPMSSSSINTSLENITQTLAPGRVPNTSVFLSSSTANSSSSPGMTSGSGASVSGGTGGGSTSSGVSVTSGALGSGQVGSGASGGGSRALTDEDIMSTLLAYERKGKHKAAPQSHRTTSSSRQTSSRNTATNRAPVSDSEDSSSSGDEDTAGKRRAVQMNEASGGGAGLHQDDVGEEQFLVNIQGRPVAYHDITEEMIHSMTPEEQEDYIEIGRRIHEMIGM